MRYTQEDNLLIQSYFTVGLLMELTNTKFLESEYYENIEFEDKIVKENLPKYGIDNQGTLLIFLYTLLVIPKQLLEDRFPDEFMHLNSTVNKIKDAAISTYKKDKDGIDYMRHIRNAVSHARVKFKPTISVTFIDENHHGETCEITLPLQKFGLFITELQKLHRKHLLICIAEGKNG